MANAKRNGDSNFMRVKHKMKKISNVSRHLKNCFLVYFGKVQLGFLVVSVGQACNFKCRNCANFAPISPDSFKRYNVQDLKKDLAILFENIEFVEQLQIQGGEPLLYSDLIELVDFLHENKAKVHEIVVATNGSLVPDDALLQCFKRSDVCVRISDYGIARESCSAFMERLKQYNIRSYLYSFVSNQSLWYDCGEGYTGGGHFDIWKRYYSCAFRGCLTLERGELSYCSRATNSYAIQGFSRKAADYFNLRESKDHFQIRLAEYLTFRHPMQACCYCNGTNQNHMVLPAIQIKTK